MDEEIELRKIALEYAIKYDVSRDQLLPVAHSIFIWLKRGTGEAANCKWVMIEE